MQINIFAVIVAAALNMVFGAIWYGIFGNMWMNLIGKKKEELKSNSNMGYIFTSIGALVLSFALAILVYWSGAVTIGGGLRVGLVVGIGVSAMTMLPDYMFAGRPKKLYLLNAVYPVITIILMSILLAVWR